MNEEDKFLYEKAIEGRQHHQENFNHWMNMYAIFNGALFVGYYSIDDKNTLFAFLLLVLGCATGWSWHFSATGFYDWILSWIQVVKKHEEKLDSAGKKCVVYRAYEGKRTISTQKITKLFSLLVAIAWSILLINTFMSIINPTRVCEKILYWSLSICGLGIIVEIFRHLVLESEFTPEQID